MRRPEARSRQTNRPDGVTFSFQVSLNKVEPAVADRSFNLLTKDRDRAALLDELEPGWPEVSGVFEAKLPAGRREPLAGTTAGPNFARVRPPGLAQGVAPDPDPGEEVTLGVALEVLGLDIQNAPLVNVAGRDQPLPDQLPQPGSCLGVVLVVVGFGHF